MTYAFLLLTYDNIKNDKINSYIQSSNNLYIHPKYPNNIISKYREYVIDDLIEPTAWCEISIVNATINLLKAAFEDSQNEWFILLSEDSYPIYSYGEFIEKFNQIQNNKHRSIFNLILLNDTYYKTSQWWIMNRNDAQIIINNQTKYASRFKHRISNGCFDEYYFLSVLMWNNPNYQYINHELMYTKWLSYTIQKSPAIINKLLEEDLTYIKNSRCLFLRKISNNFTLDKYITRRKLYVIYIGTETIQSNIVFNDDFDFILIISIDISKVRIDILNRAIYIYNIIYKFLFESILNICNETYIKNWDLIIFTTERFNMNNYNQIEKIKKYLPYDKFQFANKNLLLTNRKEFYYIIDNNNNLAFCFKN